MERNALIAVLPSGAKGRHSSLHRTRDEKQMSLAEAITAIAAGPKGPETGAFFDFDGTLIDGFSALAYFTDKLRRRELGLREAADIIRVALRRDMNEREFDAFFAKNVAEWAGHPEDELTALWSGLFEDTIAGWIFPEAWDLVKAHQKMGHTVAIASSATRYQVAPIAQELGIEHVLCTRVMVREGKLTGRVDGMTLWGTGKAQAVLDFAERQGVVLAHSYGYANGNEDIAFLKTVRHATAVNPKPALVAAAQREGWAVLRLPPRRKASWAMRARSAGAYGALAAASLGDFAYAMLSGKKRRATEWVGAAALSIAGIKVEVEGAHHLQAHRPCVFLYNHQSAVDDYVLLTLRGLDSAFIDQTSGCGAIEAMQPAIDRLKRGMSVVIAPEGTRSVSPRLGRFKKGAFHIAMQAGVPIVPIVLRNTCAVLPRHSLLFRPGTVQVRVLPPIDVTTWTVDDLDRHVADVRDLFQRTLDDDHSPATRG
jgi:putative phosphoserine phosphatase/1-acylglycerol-3-phosphate O-acyltransferase